MATHSLSVFSCDTQEISSGVSQAKKIKNKNKNKFRSAQVFVLGKSRTAASGLKTKT
jgi:hypothetical protein